MTERTGGFIVIEFNEDVDFDSRQEIINSIYHDNILEIRGMKYMEAKDLNTFKRLAKEVNEVLK